MDIEKHTHDHIGVILLVLSFTVFVFVFVLLYRGLSSSQKPLIETISTLPFDKRPAYILHQVSSGRLSYSESRDLASWLAKQKNYTSLSFTTEDERIIINALRSK